MNKEQRYELKTKKKIVEDIDKKVLKLLSLGYQNDSPPIKALYHYKDGLNKEIEQIKIVSGSRR